MELTSKNYHSPEANKEFMSVSQYKDFVGTYGRAGCEARALAKLNQEYKQENTDALLIGSYVDAYFEGTFPEFANEHPELFKKTGELYAKYSIAEDVIRRCERDKLFMQAMTGEKQKIFTAELFGVKWKIKIDNYNPEKGYITDLKVMRDISKSFYVPDMYRMSFVEYWGYVEQMAVYQKIEQLATGRVKPLSVYIAAVDKQTHPNIAVITIDQRRLDDMLGEIEFNMKHVLDVKSGVIEPVRCDICDYCKDTKKLKRVIHYTELIDG